eukprot:scaffold1683_cov125-Isochrysis_galbana.AAC.3
MALTDYTLRLRPTALRTAARRAAAGAPEPTTCTSTSTAILPLARAGAATTGTPGTSAATLP